MLPDASIVVRHSGHFATIEEQERFAARSSEVPFIRIEWARLGRQEELRTYQGELLSYSSKPLPSSSATWCIGTIIVVRWKTMPCPLSGILYPRFFPWYDHKLTHKANYVCNI